MKESINQGHTDQSSYPKIFSSNFSSWVNLSAATLTAIVGLATLSALFLSLRLNKERREGKSLESRWQSLKVEKENLVQLQLRQESLKLIGRNQRDVKETIDAIKENIPLSVTLTGLSIRTGEIVIQGQTPTGETLTQFAQSLLASGKFKEVTLTGGSFDDFSKTYKFQLRCRLN